MRGICKRCGHMIGLHLEEVCKGVVKEGGKYVGCKCKRFILISEDYEKN